jgi:tetratricopeptide (TPR) repeat protein
VRFPWATHFLVLTRKDIQLNEILTTEIELLEPLQLSLNTEKVRLGSLLDTFNFLGFTFSESGKQPSSESVSNLLRGLHTGINKTQSLVNITDQLKNKWQGWKNYYCQSQNEVNQVIENIDTLIHLSSTSVNTKLAFLSFLLLNDKQNKVFSYIDEIQDSDLVTDQQNYYFGLILFSIQRYSDALYHFQICNRKNPDKFNVHYYIGHCYYALNKYKNAINHLQWSLDLNPGCDKTRLLLQGIYKLLDLDGIGQSLSQSPISECSESVKHEPNDDNFLNISFTEKVNESEYCDSQITSLRDNEHNNSSEPYSIMDVVEEVWSIFSGREDRFAKGFRKTNGSYGFLPISNPFTQNDLLAHLNQEIFAGVYVLRTDSTVLFSVIDIDSKNFHCFPEDQRMYIKKQTFKVVKEIQSLAMKNGLPSYIEDTGGKGYHLWFFYEKPISAKVAKNLMKKVIYQAPSIEKHVYIDLFPNTDKLPSQDVLGPLIQVPLGKNPSTNIESYFLDVNDEPISKKDLLLYLKGIQKISPEGIQRYISITESSNRYSFKMNPNITNLFCQCKVLSTLLEQAQIRRELRHIERLTLLYTLYPLGQEGFETIHYLMGLCPNYSRRITQRWIDKCPSHIFPIGCIKIRDWLSYITQRVECNCHFRLNEGEYPSPIRHIWRAYLTLRKRRKDHDSLETQQTVTKKEENRISELEKTVDKASVPESSNQGDFEDLIIQLMETKKKISSLECVYESLKQQIQNEDMRDMSKEKSNRNVKIDENEIWIKI